MTGHKQMVPWPRDHIPAGIIACCAQVTGRKRMAFWPPDALDSLYLYPIWHLLLQKHLSSRQGSLQVTGRKRMVFWPPDALDSLYLYPNWHLLRRRSRCDPAHPDFRRHPKFRQLVGVEVSVLRLPAAMDGLHSAATLTSSGNPSSASSLAWK